MDVAPTVVELLGLDPQPPEMTGRSLLPYLDGREAPEDLPALAHLVWPNSFTMTSLRWRDRKLIQTRGAPGGRGDRVEFFDLRRDRAERNALPRGAEGLHTLGQLRRSIEAARAQRDALPWSAEGHVDLTDSIRRQLEALGYLREHPDG